MMTTPMEVVFKDVQASEAVEATARRHVKDLAQLHEQMDACRVTVRGHDPGCDGPLVYAVGIEFDLAGARITVNRALRLTHAHPDVYVALRHAFAQARDRIRRHLRKAAGQTGQAVQRGRIASVLPEAGYGFIETRDHRQVYFHAAELLGAALDLLRVGDPVRFSEHRDEGGAVATHVERITRGGAHGAIPESPP